MRHQLTIELGGQLSTVKQFEQIRKAAFLGGGYELGYDASKISFGTNVGYIGVRLGVGLVDSPVMSPLGNSSVQGSGDTPLFSPAWCPSAAVTLVHPLTTSLSVFLSANFFEVTAWYPSHYGPDQWNISVGGTLSLDSIKSTLGIKQ